MCSRQRILLSLVLVEPPECMKYPVFNKSNRVTRSSFLSIALLLNSMFQLGDQRFRDAAMKALEGLWKSRSKLGLVKKLFHDIHAKYKPSI